MSIQIHTATREESNNRAMPASESKSGIVLRGISLGSLEILRQPVHPLSTAEADLSAVDMRVLAEFLWVHGAPIEEVLDTVYNTPTQVARKAAAFPSRHPECQRRTPAGCRRPSKPKRAHPALVASWVFTIARAGGGAKSAFPPDPVNANEYSLTRNPADAYDMNRLVNRLRTAPLPLPHPAFLARIEDVATAGFMHGGVNRQFSYSCLSGSNLLHTLTQPNGITLTQSYEEHHDLLTGMQYHRGSTLVAERSYGEDKAPDGCKGDWTNAQHLPEGRGADGAEARQPIQWSSEYNDSELGLVYYNYRHYNPVDGRWAGRDSDFVFNTNTYRLVNGRVVSDYDYIGLIAPGAEGAQAAANSGANYGQGNVTYGLDKKTTCCKDHHENPKGVGIAFLNGKDPSEQNLFKMYASAKGRWLFTPATGKEFLEALEVVTRERCGNCISNLTIAGHGHGTYSDTNGIPGSDMTNSSGFYLQRENDGMMRRLRDFLFGNEARYVSDLSEKVASGSIKFCQSCLIQIYGCRTGESFASALAKTSGCDVVFATGGCSPAEVVYHHLPSGRFWLSGPSGDYNVFRGFKVAKPTGIIEDHNPLKHDRSSTYEMQ